MHRPGINTKLPPGRSNTQSEGFYLNQTGALGASLVLMLLRFNRIQLIF